MQVTLSFVRVDTRTPTATLGTWKAGPRNTIHHGTPQSAITKHSIETGSIVNFVEAFRVIYQPKQSLNFAGAVTFASPSVRRWHSAKAQTAGPSPEVSPYTDKTDRTMMMMMTNRASANKQNRHVSSFSCSSTLPWCPVESKQTTNVLLTPRYANLALLVA